MSLHGPDLGEALHALRSLGDDADGDPGTRDRVLESLDRRDQRRRTLVSFAVVLAIFFTGGTSWAWFSGWLPAVVQRIVEPEKVVAPPPKPAAAPAKRRSAPAAVTAPAPAAVPEAAPVAAPVVVVPEPTVIQAPAPPPVARAVPAVEHKVRRVAEAPRRKPETAAILPPEPAVAPAPPAPEPAPVAAAPAPVAAAPAPAPAPVAIPTPARVPDAELRAYRVAHAAHFRGNDAARALSAWDEYLAAFPDGKLAPEARWNRALVLVRLGRTDDALRALASFASAEAGGYRQREAARLSEALRARR